MKRIAILGSTGSVGTQALELVVQRRDQLEVVALSAWRSADLLDQQVARFAPAAACLAGGRDRAPAAETAWFEGEAGILAALEATQPDLVLNAITGAAGLPASEWCLRHGIALALANKESLVMAGGYLMKLARATATPLLPVDSEHCAIHQCLRGEDRKAVRRVWLTGSGGPFRQRPRETFAEITPAEALRHPTWRMGPRITVGSATMMNKAFEIIEACWLFDLDPEQVQVVIHPQSIVHSMVELVDGSILAQLGAPDMRMPILYCLAYPERMPLDLEPFDPVRFHRLTFEAVDEERYPAIPLAYAALRGGGDCGAVLNAADEVMTGLFLDGKVSFPAIVEATAEVLRRHQPRAIESLQDVRQADRAAREAVSQAVSV